MCLWSHNLAQNIYGVENISKHQPQKPEPIHSWSTCDLRKQRPLQRAINTVRRYKSSEWRHVAMAQYNPKHDIDSQASSVDGARLFSNTNNIFANFHF